MTQFARSLPVLAVSFTCLTLTVGCSDLVPERAIAPSSPAALDRASDVDVELQGYLTLLGFTGRIADQLENDRCQPNQPSRCVSHQHEETRYATSQRRNDIE